MNGVFGSHWHVVWAELTLSSPGRYCPRAPPLAALICYGVFSLHRAADRPQTRRLRRASDPPKMEWKGLIRSASGTQASVSQRQNKSDRPRTSDSSTNQIVFHGLPSNVHSFPVMYWERWKGKCISHECQHEITLGIAQRHKGHWIEEACSERFK